jgi:hypothetical protein
MGSGVGEKTIGHFISEYLNASSSKGTDLERAYLALSERSLNAKKKLMSSNTLFPIIQAYIGYSAGEFRWSLDPITLTEVDVSDGSAVAEAARTHLDMVTDLYDIADHVIEQQGKPIDSHDSNHIERCLLQLQSLLSLRERHSVSGKAFSNEDLLVAYGMVVQHDVALGLTGRQIPHEEVAAVLTPSVLAVKEGSPRELKQVPSRIAMNTRYHVTSKYDFDWVKSSGNSAAFALAVLADETDISYKRATDVCIEKFMRGERDDWFYLNYFTHHTRWGWDTKNGCPLLQIVTFADDQRHMKLHGDYMLRNTAEVVTDKSGHMKEYYRRVAYDLLFANPKKVSLFKSACSSIFSVKHVSVQITDIKSVPFDAMVL